METEKAAEHLQIIRTLMERAAVYRRALAPVTLLAGVLGLAAGVGGWIAGFDSPRRFGVYWLCVAGVAVFSGFLIARRQAWRDEEPFWSPPTRRVAQALMPPFVAGLAATLVFIVPKWREPLHVWWLPAAWMILYGCAIHGAGFFLPRSSQVFGWLFLVAGCAVSLLLNERMHAAGMPSLATAHLLMGAVFGGLHLIYGGYLAFTESRRNVS
jgi:hypothetical protein